MIIEFLHVCGRVAVVHDWFIRSSKKARLESLSARRKLGGMSSSPGAPFCRVDRRAAFSSMRVKGALSGPGSSEILSSSLASRFLVRSGLEKVRRLTAAYCWQKRSAFFLLEDTVFPWWIRYSFGALEDGVSLSEQITRHTLDGSGLLVR